MKKTLSLIIIAIIALATSINANAWTDRNTFNLKGPVKAVYDGFYNDEMYSFDSDGTLYSITGERVIVDSRNKQGKITSCRWAESPQFYEFKYNQKGLLIQEISSGGTCAVESIIKYTYNAKGQVIKQIWDGDITTYTYQAFDSYGNWTKRTAKTGKTRTVQTRTITYYE